MKNTVGLLVVFLLFTWRVALAQDIIYTISAELDGEAVSLDSILFENLSNHTGIWFRDLPVQTEYIINLSTKKLQGPAGTTPFIPEDAYRIMQNLPGLFSLSYVSGPGELVRVKIFSIQGTEMFSSQNIPLDPGNTLNVKLAEEGIYLVKITGASGYRTIKAMGAPGDGVFGVSTGQEWSGGFSADKGSKKMTGYDFSFSPGDSLRISVNRYACYARPSELEITGSSAVHFIMKASMVESYGVSDAWFPLSTEMQESLQFDELTGEIRFPVSAPGPFPQEGEIIAIDRDSTGFLRKIVSVNETDGVVILGSVPAYLNELFVNTSLKLDTNFREPATPLKKSATAAELANALRDNKGYLHPVRVFYQKQNGTRARKSVYSTADGPAATIPLINYHHDLSFMDIYGSYGDATRLYISEGEISQVADAAIAIDFNYNGQLDEQTRVRIGDLQEFSYHFNSKAGYSSKLVLEMNSSFNFEKTDPQKLLDLPSFTALFMIPPAIPLWITANCDIYGNFSISGDAFLVADWGFAKSDSLVVGASYSAASGEFTPYTEYWPENTVYPLNLNGELDAAVRFEIFPRIEVKLYDFIGPYADIAPHVTAHFNSSRMPVPGYAGTSDFLAWNSWIDLGLDFRVGAELSFLGLIEKKLGPASMNAFELPLWSAPKNLISLSPLPGNVDPGSSHTLSYKVTDELGLPVPLCPVSFTGDGTFSDLIMHTDSSGTASVSWTAQPTTGTNSILVRIFGSDQSVIASDAVTVTVGDDQITYGTVYDIDGNKYKTLKVGGREWMAENLKTTRYNDGAAIPLVIGTTEWNEQTTPGYCWYNNNMLAFKDTYGALYNWYTVETDKLCPLAWHVASDADWKAIIESAGGMAVAGDALKETGTLHWVAPNSGATDAIGFRALPAGARGGTVNNGFQGLGTYAYFWSSTPSDVNADWAIEWFLYSGYGYPVRVNGQKKYAGFAVRCVKD